MSTLKVTNIQATGETASRAVSGVAAAWVNFNGTGTIAARDSLNVSSLTDNGTGDHGVSFSNSMANANYATLGTNGSETLNITNWITGIANLQVSSSVRLRTTNGGTANLSDRAYLMSLVHGDLT